jgi:hypothetical protein
MKKINAECQFVLRKPMKKLKVKRSRFRLKKFLAALHQFGSGNPLPGVSGDIVHHDSIDLAEALAEGEDFEMIPDDSLERLEIGLTLFGYFALFNGDNGFNCIDGKEVEVPCLDDEEDDEDQPRLPRRRRAKKYREAIENTTCNECSAFGYVVSLDGDAVEIEGKRMSDISGEGQLEMMLAPNLLSDAMRRWAKTFVMRPKRTKS